MIIIILGDKMKQIKNEKYTKFKSAAFIFAVLVISILIISCKPNAPPGGTGGNKLPNAGTTKFETSQGLKKFSSEQEVKDFLKNSALQASGGSSFYGGNSMKTMSADESSVRSAAPQSISAASGNSGSAADFSKTNVQVEGVDEADLVKNDGKYIYTLTQNKLVIVDAYPAEDAKTLSETKINGTPRNIFVNKDRLVVFSDDNGEVYALSPYDFVPRPRYTQRTHAFVYDISNKKNPKLVKDYNLNGYYLQSRMIDNYVYFIVQEYVYYYNDFVDLPAVMESSKTILRPEIYYFDNPEYNYNFNTVASFDVFGSNDNVNAKSFMMGYANTIYVSQNNIYITYQKNLPYDYYESHNEDRFFDVVVPLLPSDARNKIEEIKKVFDVKEFKNKGDYQHALWNEISKVIEEMYNRMDKNEKEKLIQKIEKEVEDYEAKLAAERAKTVIQKIKISNGKIDYATRGEVPGYLLNQFSLDEKDDNLRVATTTEIWAREHVMYNNVFVLDSRLEAIGKLEAVAPDEKIYSTRFLGDRLYMVTFKRVDPLFVIDLSNPKNPEVLGKLKIPGFSDYLHPYDENHIIGIGKETDSNEWGGTSIKGVKLALFDVSDVKNPKQLDKYEIGEAGTDSEALRDHKAFLFDLKKNLLVIPITEVKGKLEYDAKLGYYRQKYWQGAYVFNVDLKGFTLKGKITHNEGDEQQNYYWYGSPNAVRRSLFMDDVLYTVSGIKIKANDLNNIDKEIKEIDLPYEINYNPYPIYRGGGPVMIE